MFFLSFLVFDIIRSVILVFDIIRSVIFDLFLVLFDLVYLKLSHVELICESCVMLFYQLAAAMQNTMSFFVLRFCPHSKTSQICIIHTAL